MVASYRLQLTPDFVFEDVRALLPYFQKLGVSHLYLSPITEARRGSTHGYDVIDHNAVREAFGGAEGLESLREAAQGVGLSLILDFVPNHAGVGPRNVYWQDILAYGPFSEDAAFFDIDWDPLKDELHDKILLPFLGKPYGEVLEGELSVGYDDGRFYARYYDNRFALSPSSYDAILGAALPSFERTEVYFDLKDLLDAYETLEKSERTKAEGLRTRLLALSENVDWDALLKLPTEAMHALLERQFWRLSYWKTAGSEINYRRFFDINELVGLRMENSEVFWDSHRLLGELVVKEGVAGVRIDHIDGLFDPQGYLEALHTLGAKKVWVEKILAPGETLPEDWLTVGTSGYEFMNDAMGVLTYGGSEEAIKRLYRRFVDGVVPYEEEVHRSKRLVMGTSLSGELVRLANELDRLSEADYRTRDFTLEALREALLEIIAAFSRYRTYLPHRPDEAREVIHEAIERARRRSVTLETSVYEFIERMLVGEVREDLQEMQAAFIGRFQQYTAPVAAKGVEDTAFYRYLPLVALNEVGGEPEHIGVTPQAFHARSRFRAYRYPDNLLATATHDHKRGEDTRMRLIVLSELTSMWEETLVTLLAEADKVRRGGLEASGGPSRNDVYLFYQLLVALWIGPDGKVSEDRETLADRLVDYMRKAAREAKLHSSWLNPNEAYEAALEGFVRETVSSDAVGEIVEGLAGQLAYYGFANSLAQLVLKTTTPGMPDFYQGTELSDLSLVDPDNRRPVDYKYRDGLLEEFAGLLGAPDAGTFKELFERRDERLKLFVTSRLLRFRREHSGLFCGEYRALELSGEAAEHGLAFSREADGKALVVFVTRFPATLEERGGWGDAEVTLPDGLAGRSYEDVVTGLRLDGPLKPDELPLPFAVLLSTDAG